MFEASFTPGELHVDHAARRVSYQGREIALSPRELAILEALLERPGMPLSRFQIRERLYGTDRQILANPVQVHVHNLRAKLGADVIRTVRGLGYVIDPS